MKVIEVYQCEVCGKESRNKSKIKNHEVQCKIQRKKELEAKKNKEKWEKEFLETFHPSKLKEYINEYLEKFGVAPFEELSYSLHYSNNVSNSHECPRRGVTNWGGRDQNKPTSYPGFKGLITGKYNSDNHTISEYCSSFPRKVKIPGIHSGSGGGGEGGFSYELKIFLDDFPNFKKEFEDRHRNAEVKANLLGNYDYRIEEEYYG